MKFFDYIRTALKNLWRQKSRTFLTIMAIVIGAVSVIIMLSIVIGAKRTVTEQIQSIGGLTLITVSSDPNSDSGSVFGNGGNSPDGKKLDDTTVAALKNIDHVEDLTPVASVFINSMKLQGEDKKVWSNISSFDPSTNVISMPVQYGRKLAVGDKNKIVVSSAVIRAYGFSSHPQDLVGKTMLLQMQGAYSVWEPDPPKPPDGDNKDYWNNLQSQSRDIAAEIVGVITNSQDDRTNFITLDWARKLSTTKSWQNDDAKMQAWKQQNEALQQSYQATIDQQKKSGNYSYKPPQIPQPSNSDFMVLKTEDGMLQKGYASIILKVDTRDNIDSVAKEIAKLGLGATTLLDMIAQINKMFYLIGAVLGTIGGIALFVAAIGIINTMIMATYERTREIGVMRACGATKGAIRFLFTVEAALLGFWGGVIGLAISYGLGLIGNYVAGRIASSNSIPIQNIITFPLWLILAVIAFTTVIGMLAGLYPAMRASRLDPVEALRYE